MEPNSAITGTGLIYYPDSAPGIARRRCGRGFTYLAPDGTRIDRGTERQRLEAMAVPPAYDDVWMSPLENGHLLATGTDDRARKQYRYHPDWTEAQSKAKWQAIADFGASLPRLRRRLRRDLKAQAGTRTHTVAAALTLIDRLCLRVGNPGYTAQNGSYGALTLCPRHVKQTDSGLRLSYRAKGGQDVTRGVPHHLQDMLLALARSGPTLLTWRDSQGRHRLNAGLLNAELCEMTGLDSASAKDFRSWAGSAAAMAARAADAGTGITGMAKAAADRLANTPAVARNSYIHPKVIALGRTCSPVALPKALPELTKAETALLDLV